jgi:hypothetical protein
MNVWCDYYVHIFKKSKFSQGYQRANYCYYYYDGISMNRQKQDTNIFDQFIFTFVLQINESSTQDTPSMLIVYY